MLSNTISWKCVGYSTISVSIWRNIYTQKLTTPPRPPIAPLHKTASRAPAWYIQNNLYWIESNWELYNLCQNPALVSVLCWFVVSLCPFFVAFSASVSCCLIVSFCCFIVSFSFIASLFHYSKTVIQKSICCINVPLSFLLCHCNVLFHCSIIFIVAWFIVSSLHCFTVLLFHSIILFHCFVVVVSLCYCCFFGSSLVHRSVVSMFHYCFVVIVCLIHCNVLFHWSIMLICCIILMSCCINVPSVSLYRLVSLYYCFILSYCLIALFRCAIVPLFCYFILSFCFIVSL